MLPKDLLSTAQQPAISPHNSASPLISEHQRTGLQDGAHEQPAIAPKKDPKSFKERLLELAGKKREHKANMEAVNASAFDNAANAAGTTQQRQPDLKPQPRRTPASPSRLPYHAAVSASPSRLRSSSPRLHSPASSEIFERNVQEPLPISTLSNELTDAHIPAHVMTEDDIPPALDASTEAITSKSLNPDDVEIVMSASHQPAAASVLDASMSYSDMLSLNSPMRFETPIDSEPAPSLQTSSVLQNLDDEVASSYGQLDPNDVRRLSFISFKDIVHSELQQQQHLAEMGYRDSLHIGGHSFSSSMNERATSPLRSPRSPTSSATASGGVTTPPPGLNISHPLTEQSPGRIGSPGSMHGSAHGHGELTIETMSQSIRKTASGDLSNIKIRDGSDGIRSAGLSPVGDENDFTRQVQSRSRTNS
ncbi:hypothetical protein CERZMDRAFT_94022 [Cercospora zeae-maydis SCOH1-5]|uniref:Uncharacterized protein n=1 Tax=Cercospora zeae-maydis SCOH1-5 TaxID=717836 RepID=A0A6A6FQ90_9PEZI|nr:hypothetical protein CERZMDRAFT_94022 [Cercospora zeae-maydis SCOH1-5]